jgi:NAD(P)-dependent dehydrogenase (short-subunit alcohol dehydrogenase family)
MVSSPANVVIAGNGERADQLAAYYRQRGSTVAVVSFDLLVIADDFDPEVHSISEVSRGDLAAAMHRLVYWPFHTAAAFKPRLAAAGGRVVLLSATTARMEHVDTAGLYLDRPFRTAAHALWRCLSVEWHADGITCGIVGLDHGRPRAIEELAAAIAGGPDEAFPVELTDIGGRRLGW